MKRFKIISLHYTTKCDMNCPFCYKERSNKEKKVTFWYKLIPYFAKLTNQIAIGGGEPFTNLNFIKKFSAKCKKKNLIVNVTTNGKLLMALPDNELKNVLKDITMVSISYDNYKIKGVWDLQQYIRLVKRIKKLTKTQVGSNLLISERMFNGNVNKDGLGFILIVNRLFRMGCDRVFALFPKNIPFVDIIKYKGTYRYLTLKHKHFYVDDLTKQIIEQECYKDWCNECHYFKDIISINEQGYITGCSFDNKDKALLKLVKPKDIIKILNIKGEKRFNCPYLKLKENGG